MAGVRLAEPAAVPRHRTARGKTVGIDATTLEANAALRSIVRRDTGEGYETFLRQLAEASDIPTPTRAELARFDRKRPKKGSNDEWTHPQDPDAKTTRMKDGRTHLAHKAEHAVNGSIVRMPISTRAVDCAACIYAAIPMCSSVFWSTSAASIWACLCGA